MLLQVCPGWPWDLKSFLPAFIDPSGEANETCRDAGHTMIGLAELAQCAEIAFKQGVDLYSELPDAATGMPRLAMGFEYTAKIKIGLTLPSHCGTTKDDSPTYSIPMWETGYNHYHNRKNLTMEFTGKMVNKTRPEGF